ncbi:receptor-like protein kinase 1 [Dorcoceras hygrometricum]|uniref:Receptor-like serine/threonine-protein kinase n=1 Tax=Dorcoceras hygrometricum TaxID=472368 RepID=A0A2Z7CCI1_9LAMI|nr:receptor-like protein kinase 1 [Dorcoceras hygrometricum]
MDSKLCNNLISFLVLLIPLCAVSQNSGNITVGASLTADGSSKPWLSPTGDFAFGFQQLPNNKDLFLLSIWFDQVPEKTVIWYTNGKNPVPRGSRIQLVAAGGLELRDPHNQIIWSTNLSPDETAYGYLNDTGNLVLFGSVSNRLWESFKNPADTIVPTQVIETNGMLISRKSVTNFSQGRFYARILDNGSFVLSTKSVASNIYFDFDYYTSPTSDLNASNSGYQVVFSERGSLFVRKRNGEQFGLSSRSLPPASENYYRATLNFDGVLIQYYHPKNGNPGWNVVGYWPDNICNSIYGLFGSGACGYNSVCQLKSGRPRCVCPRGFTLADPNDPYGDCKPNTVMSCMEGETGSLEDIFELVEIQDTDWPFNDYSQIVPSTEADCRSSCMNDCLCGAAIFRNHSCWKKRLPLSNGRTDATLDIKVFLRLRKGHDVPFLNRKNTKNQKTLIIIGSVLLASSVFLCITVAFVVFFLKYKKKITNSNTSLTSIGSNLRCFTYEELEQATSGFKKDLGRGAFGTVYKGVLPDSSETIIAVKKLERVAKDSEKEFRAEVNVIGHTHHKNLVRLLGYCHEGPNRLLVYEYMRNGTLAKFLFGEKKPRWVQRTQMALGVAKGLTYLHEECSNQIIHCDIKPQNILLDEYYTARISDFGLSKLLMMEQSRTSTDIRGTKGYVAPEWFRNTQITVKVDVYSFGVLLLEIVCCRKSLEYLKSSNDELSVLTDWVWDCYTERRLDILVENDYEALDDLKMVERFVKVGLWCIQDDISLRPSMKKASLMLEGIVDVKDPPCPYAFSTLS